MRGLVVVLTLVFYTVAAPIFAILESSDPQVNVPALVIAFNAVEVVDTAGGRLVGPQQAPFAVLAIGDRAFIDSIRGPGIWLARDGTWLAQLCGYLT